MSEKEKLMRAAYQRRRKRLITLQTVIIAILSLALIFAGHTYLKLNKDTFVSYKENGNVIYKAYLADNEFYSEEYLNGSHAYVASLVEKMTADFDYTLKMGATDVNYKYSYKIEAQLEVKDKETQMAIYNPVYTLVSQKTETASGAVLSVKDSVELDYNGYNQIAKNFLAAYGLKDTESTLAVRMYVDVLGESSAFAAENENRYVIELFVPLVKPTVTPYTATTVAEDEQKVLALNNNDTRAYKNIMLALAAADALLLIVLAVFVVRTRDKHLDYAVKVKRLVSAYKSYIQKINNSFDMSGYQVLHVDTFTELLEIRDTLQIPVLMYENEDMTCSQFFVAAENILYLYEIGVCDDYGTPKYKVEKETVKL